MDLRVRRGAAIRARRRELGLNQDALAAAAGVSQEWVSKLERGTVRAPGADGLVRLAAALRLDPAALLAGGIDAVGIDAGGIDAVGEAGSTAADAPRPRGPHARVAAVLPRLTESEAAAVAAFVEWLAHDRAREKDPR